MWGIAHGDAVAGARGGCDRVVRDTACADCIAWGCLSLQ